MATLSVTDASRKAGVSRQTIYEQISRGEINRTPDGIDLSELMRVYPNLANSPKDDSVTREISETHDSIETVASSKLADQADQANRQEVTIEQTIQQAGTVELLVRELEWNKELLEQTNQLMARQLAEQRSLIAGSGQGKSKLHSLCCPLRHLVRNFSGFFKSGLILG